jgi:toxin ParE1/3/4
VRRFRQAVEAGLALIANHPKGQPLVGRNTRRVLLRRFPYSLFYYVEGDTVVVYGRLHGSRDPRVWQDRAEAALD